MAMWARLAGVNSGVMIIRNSKWSLDFFVEVGRIGNLCYDKDSSFMCYDDSTNNTFAPQDIYQPDEVIKVWDLGASIPRLHGSVVSIMPCHLTLFDGEPRLN
jgi:hypothetical protein